MTKYLRSPEFNDRVLASIRMAQETVMANLQLPPNPNTGLKSGGPVSGAHFDGTMTSDPIGNVQCGAATDSLWQVSVSGLGMETAQLFSEALVADLALRDEDGPATVQVLCTRQAAEGMTDHLDGLKEFNRVQSNEAGICSPDGRRKRFRKRGKVNGISSGEVATAPIDPPLRRTDDIQSCADFSRDVDLRTAFPGSAVKQDFGSDSACSKGPGEIERCGSMMGNSRGSTSSSLWTVDCVPRSGGPARAVEFAVHSLLGLDPKRTRILI